jgi:S-phase kinase-associated protein 1
LITRVCFFFDVYKFHQKKKYFSFFTITITKQSSEQMSETVTLKSKDNVTITVSSKAIKLSVTVKELLEDLEGSVSNEVPVAVNADTLKKVVEWLEHSKDKFDDEPVVVNEEDRKLPELDEWDNTFCDGLDDDAKVNMILAANLMDIKPLLDIVCISVANLVKGQSPEELRKVLERTSKPIPDDLSEGIPGIKKMEQKKVEEIVVTGEAANKDAEESKRKR